jgi:phthiodiolone/phenolphthiodiolone dimycocerosates ketoreductase
MAIRVGLVAMPNLPPRELRLLLRMGRLLGVDSFLAADHWQDFVPRSLWTPSVTWRATISPSPHTYGETFTMLGNLAPIAGNVRLGTAVTEVLRRHPVMVAQAALTLARLTKRRPVLGVGAGERLNTGPYGIEELRPVDRLEEALRVIRLCWESDGPVDLVGKHYSLTGAVMDFSTGGGEPPEIWVAAHGPRMLRITGELADGWIPSMPPIQGPAHYEETWRTVQAAARDAGRSGDAIEPSLFALVLLAPTDQRVERLLGSTLVRYHALFESYASWWSELGLEHPLGPGHRGYIDILPEAIDRATLERAIARVPPEIVRSCFLTGTPQRIVAQLRDFEDAGLRHVVLAPVSALYRRRDYAYVPWALGRLTRLLRD